MNNQKITDALKTALDRVAMLSDAGGEVLMIQIRHDGSMFIQTEDASGWGDIKGAEASEEVYEYRTHHCLTEPGGIEYVWVENTEQEALI